MNESDFVRRFGPTSAEYNALAPYPRQTTEFEIQAWLVMKLLDVGFDVRGETPIRLPSGRQCYFDLLVFDREKHLQYIIEIKTFRAKGKLGQHGMTQWKTYLRFGVPVLFVYGMEGAFELRDQLLKWRALDEHIETGRNYVVPDFPDDYESFAAWKLRDRKH
ncbi:hypothetical protein CTP10_R47090 [Cupriavidus sp. P-10]|uniref:hypothetical protein n=1 Tax=Cupriavidus sp. P-10 TaxID=2027911 RepID=UPI000E2F9856|nr:hypothetical protein [Cupriavidus sp. P-10]BDB27304.1 hypothetical protein CTP10_R47090 [Cupriavidus sp. P-10]